MADPGGASLQQQALRRQYEGSGASYTPYQHFYAPYGGQYPTYPQHVNNQHFHQQVNTQSHWPYYNSSPYARPQSSYQMYNQYPYQQSAHYPARNAGHTHHSYNSVGRNHLDAQSSYGPSVQGNSLTQVSTTESSERMSEQSPSSVLKFSGHRTPYYPPLPWLSMPEEPFPNKNRKLKRRPRPQSPNQPVKLPTRPSQVEKESTLESSTRGVGSSSETLLKDTKENDDNAEILGLAEGNPSTSEHQNFAEDTSTKGSLMTATSQLKTVVVPVIPRILPPNVKNTSFEQEINPSKDDPLIASVSTEDSSQAQSSISNEISNVKSPPKSWAELLKGAKAAGSNQNFASSTKPSPFLEHNRSQDTLGTVISTFAIDASNRLSFLKPRGLINSGNMCYMNSILQALVACVPFYGFLSHISQRVVYSFKSDTPLLDSLIMFMKEFNVIDSAESADKLRLRLKPSELEEYGEPLLPEYVYEEIRKSPRFATMQRGHQQDAEEFLGFLLEELQGECERSIRQAGSLTSEREDDDTGKSKKGDDGWLEVGPRQRASTTRSSGTVNVNTPINMIFGGQIRSELRIPGAKNSVTLEPYQSLQLDIGSPDVRTIVDALKGLTKPETLHGDFQSPRGSGATATKQVFVEALPPVLILHLKRFQYDNTGGTQKIWKSIGYPLQLEIPKELFPHSKRGSFAAHGGLPRYRLTSVIYHHGKSATAGHYTTDILRQDGREWIRIDDTVLRRVRSEEVELTSDENSKAIAAALEQHRDQSMDGIQNHSGHLSDTGDGSERGWSQPKTTGKKWAGVTDGTARSSGVGTPTGQYPIKDSKVAYILFYERITT